MVKIIEKEEENKIVMQANFSAVLYLITEQQALIGRLLQQLMDTGTLNSQQLTKVTDITDGDEGLIPTYTQLYDRFATYYLRTKALLDEGRLEEDADLNNLKGTDGEKGEDDE